MALAETDITPDALPLDSIICGDALDVLRTLPDNSIDAIVTDPPYGLGTPPDMVDVLRAWLAGEAYTPRGRGFMGKAWDAFVPGPEYWRECLRVLKPGGHLLAFAGTRTWDVMGLALRLAGFEMRDTCQWLYGSGFPKSLDVGKQLDKMAGAKRTERRWADRYHDGITRATQQQGSASISFGCDANGNYVTAPATDAARQWDGYGTALKPAWEPIILCRKPLSESNVAANVLRWGTGALNIGASRVGVADDEPNKRRATGQQGGAVSLFGVGNHQRDATLTAGRWPANLLLSHAPDCTAGGCSLWCPVRALDAQSLNMGMHSAGHARKAIRQAAPTGMWAHAGDGQRYGDNGGASRFFTTFRYQAKASRAERNRGCSEITPSSKNHGAWPGDPDESTIRTTLHGSRAAANSHPTVKPLALMFWLIGLITPPGGIVLDPFAGSGSTLCAAKAGGWRYIGIEKEAEYVAIAHARVQAS